jgi:hypothetical protein
MMIDSLDTRALVEWLDGLRLGAPMTLEALTLVPLYAHNAASSLAYRTLAEGIASDQVFVIEAPEATVPTLRVLNPARLPVLILDGEQVVGGLQDRVANTTLLVPGGVMLDLPVSCVEQGRWHEAGSSFGVGEAAYPTLRRQKIEQVSGALKERGAALANQGALWQELSERHRRDRTHSATGAMRDVYERRGTELQAAEAALAYPPDGPLGVLALIGGQSHCADIFDRPETCREYWPRLVRSYRLEAADAAAKPPSLGSAQRLLQRARKARHVAHKSPGPGFDVRLSGKGIVGAALIANSSVVHVAIFRQR